MNIKNFFLLLALLFLIGISMHLYSKITGKKLKFTANGWYQTIGILVGIFLMWKWNTIVMNGDVHEFSEEVAKIIVDIVQRIARFLGLK